MNSITSLSGCARPNRFSRIQPGGLFEVHLFAERFEPVASRIWDNITVRSDILTTILDHSGHAAYDGRSHGYNCLYFSADYAKDIQLKIMIYDSFRGGQPVTPKLHRYAATQELQWGIARNIWAGVSNEDTYQITLAIMQQQYEDASKGWFGSERNEAALALYPSLKERQISIYPDVEYGQIVFNNGRIEPPLWAVKPIIWGEEVVPEQFLGLVL